MQLTTVLRSLIAVVVRFGCYVLNLLGCGWIATDLADHGFVPVPSTLWGLAALIGVIISIRPPRSGLRHVAAIGVLLVGTICGAAWGEETPPAWLFLLALPLFASLAVLEGPSFIRTVWPKW